MQTRLPLHVLPREIPRPRIDAQTLAWIWIAGSTIVRLFSVAGAPLGNGEAYYYSWSRFPSLSYHDHPPLLAWITWVVTSFGTSPFVVRLGPILMSAAFGALVVRLALRSVSPRAALFALMLVTAPPVFLMSSVVLNPEAPLAPLWILALIALDDLRDKNEWWRPAIAGALIGLAFLAKYTGFLLIFSGISYVALSPRSRRWLSRPEFWLAALAALVVASPVLIWNITHGWPSLRLHFVERAAIAPHRGENAVSELVRDSSSDSTIARVLIGQLGAYSPIVLPFFLLGLVRIAARVRKNDHALLLACASFLPLAFLLGAMMLVKDAEPHWTMVALVPAAISAGAWLDERWEKGWIRGVFTFSIGASAVVLALINIHIKTSAFVRLLPRYDARADIVSEMVGWDDVRAALLDVSRAEPGAVIVGNQYALCGRIFYELADQPHVYCTTARRTAWDDFGRRSIPTHTTIALTSDAARSAPSELGECTRVRDVDVVRGGRTVATYGIDVCVQPDDREVSLR